MAKVYDSAFKREVCKRIVDGNETAAIVARELGINDNTIYNWVARYRESGVESFPGKGKLMPADEEMRQLRKENKDLREENEILKKAAAYFAKNQK